MAVPFTLNVPQEGNTMRLARLAVSAAITLIALPCLAEPPPLNSRADARALSDAVMQLVVADKISDAMEKLKPYWRLPPNEIDCW